MQNQREIKNKSVVKLKNPKTKIGIFNKNVGICRSPRMLAIKKEKRRGHRCLLAWWLRRFRLQIFLGAADILLDLRFQSLQRIEFLFLSQETKQKDAQALAVKIAVEIKNKGLAVRL